VSCTVLDQQQSCHATDEEQRYEDRRRAGFAGQSCEQGRESSGAQGDDGDPECQGRRVRLAQHDRAHARPREQIDPGRQPQWQHSDERQLTRESGRATRRSEPAPALESPGVQE